MLRRSLTSCTLVGVLCIGCLASRASVIVPFGISDQSVSFVGEGVNASDDGQVSVTLGTCGGGDATCNITGNFAFGGGGTYDLETIGPSPYQGVESTPTSGFYVLSFPDTVREFTLTFNNGLSATYVDTDVSGTPEDQFSFTTTFVAGQTICTGVRVCNGVTVGATPGSTITGPVTGTLTVASVPVPAPAVTINQVTGADQYNYMFDDLTGVGDVFIPIIDPSALVVSSLPGNAIIISNLTTIEADWPGTGNLIPGNEPIFDVPSELLEFPEDGADSLDISFLDADLPTDGPILADGTLLTDPLVPGAVPVPEPDALSLFGSAVLVLRFVSRRRRLR
jgi:hypothetical protein